MASSWAMFTCVLCLSASQWNHATAAAWGYSADDGPHVWGNAFGECKGQGQSPIDINTSNVWYDSGLTRFAMTGYETIPAGTSWELKNNGHTVQVDIKGDYTVSDGGLPGKFQVVQFHFHWGHNESSGAEHTLDGNTFPLELHIVHYNLKYDSVGEAIKHKDGLAVLGFFFKISKVENPSYNTFLKGLEQVGHQGDQHTLRPVPLLSLLPQNVNDYYRYAGSLTTPPCSESVTWTIFKDHIELSKAQLKIFHTFLKCNKKGETEQHMRDNFRPPQELNKRTVYSSDPEDGTMLSIPFNSPMSIALAVLLGITLTLIFMR